MSGNSSDEGIGWSWIPDRDLVGMVGVAGIMLAFGLEGSKLGISVALAIGLVWVVGGVPFAIGAAAIGFIGVFPGVSPSLGQAGGLIGGIGIAVLGTVRHVSRPGRAILVFGLGTLLFSGLALGVTSLTDSILLGGGVLFLGVGLSVYTVHRVGVVRIQSSDRSTLVSERFGFVEDHSSESDSTGTGAEVSAHE